MSGQASTVGAGIALDAMSGRATQSARTTYLALLTAAPTAATTLSTMSELTTGGYQRQAVSWTAPSGTPEVTSNTAIITFGPFTADPPNVTHAALVTASSGTSGTFLYFWQLDVAKDAAINESLQAAAGAFVMSAS